MIFEDPWGATEPYIDRPLLGGQEGGPSSQEYFMSTNKRHKLHRCQFNNHNGKPSQILQAEFGYNTTVNAMEDDDWDLIFGGYPHCIKKKYTHDFDWKMERGLNKHLAEKGWENLKPHQVWFPCMGCKDSYCNKRDLCLLSREINPDSCYKLPEDLDLLKLQMEPPTDPSEHKLWVLKRDSPTMHSHVGNGVWFIQNISEIPSKEELADDTYIVQPFVEQHMGKGAYHRRHELRLYLAVTSTTPLRAYAYNEMWVNLAHHIYERSVKVPGKCMLITRANVRGCQLQNLTNAQKSPTFAEFCSNYEMNQEQVERFEKSTRELIGNIIQKANPSISEHPVNKGITKSKAACFSFMRADLAVGGNGEASLYEINEFPFANEKGINSGRVQTQAYKDLFAMIGLDQPAIYMEKRENYELSNLGGWIPLIHNH